MAAGFAVDDGLGRGQRHFDAAQMVGPKQQVIRALSHVALDEAVPQPRLVRGKHHEHAGMDSNGKVHGARAMEHASLGFAGKTPGATSHAWPWPRAYRAHRARKPVAFATLHISTAVFEPSTNSQSIRALMSRALAARAAKRLRRRGNVQRVVLAFARRHDFKAQGRGKAVELQDGGRFVARGQRIDYPSLAGPAVENRADRHVTLDVHHDDVFLRADALQRDRDPQLR